MTTKDYSQFPYPRYYFRRMFCKAIARTITTLFNRIHVEGLENLPKDEPVLLVANHFFWADPILPLMLLPWQVEYLAGSANPAAPPLMGNLQHFWGTYQVKRDGNSRYAFLASEAVLAQGGKLMIFPEGGAWCNVLVYPRPGTILIAASNKCRIVPIALQTEGLFSIFKTGRRSKLSIVVGEPFGPIEVTGRGRARRAQLDEAGHDMMRRIAELLPPEKRGVYSDDPEIRAEAEKVAPYPWGNK